MKENKKCNCNKSAGGLFIPAGIFIGFGVGFLVNNLPAGMFLGFGLGFLAFAITMLVTKK